MTIFVALCSALIGLGLVFGGYQLARVVIPLMGFFAGLTLGGAIIADNASASFLGTTMGVVVGLAAGLALAIFAYLFYYAAIVVLTASMGYIAGSGLMLWLGFNPGLVSALVGIAAGAVLGIVAVTTNVPKVLLIVMTAIAGAVLTIGGLMLLFHAVPVEVYSYTTARFAISNSFLWSVAAILLAGFGAAAQSVTSRDFTLEEWNYMNETDHMPKTPKPKAAHV